MSRQTQRHLLRLGKILYAYIYVYTYTIDGWVGKRILFVYSAESGQQKVHRGSQMEKPKV